MKRSLIFLATFLVAVSASASLFDDRDMLLTGDGVVYSVETVQDAGDGRAAQYLQLTIQQGDDVRSEAVPASLAGGVHAQPALAYDSESRTLFIFWQEQLSRGLASRLLFASYRDGQWGEVSELDNVTWKFRRNLRIAVTRTIDAAGENGERTALPQLIVHAVWWEADGYGEWARYAMLGIDEGVVTSSTFRYLAEFTGATIDTTTPVSAYNPNETLKHPAVFATGGRDAVEVIFGDVTTSSLHRLRLRPVLDGRLRIPIGVRGASLRSADLNVDRDSRVAAIVDDDTVALYAVADDRLQYILYSNGTWSQQRSVLLNEHLPVHAAIDGLRRAVAAQ